MTDGRTPHADIYRAYAYASHGKNGNKTAKINVKNFHGSLTTVVRAQNDTSKTANITDTIFDRTLVYHFFDTPCRTLYSPLPATGVMKLS